MSRRTANARPLTRASRIASKHQRLGWEAGLQRGKPHGYHLGLCEAVLRHTAAPELGHWDVVFMYVTSGKGVPYSPLDQAIIDALEQRVSRLIVVSPTEDLAQRAAEAKPDIMLVLEGMSVAGEMIDQVRAHGIRTAIWLTDDPYYVDVMEKLVVYYDIIFTLEKQCVDYYTSIGCAKVHYLPFAANTTLFRPKAVQLHYRRDISFIGSAYWNRVDFFNRISSYLSRKEMYFCGIWWDRLEQYKALASCIDLNKWMNAEETASCYNGSQVVINMHRAPFDDTYNQNKRRVGAVSPNPRTFEIAACGTLQLCDERSDLSLFYKPGEEIVIYRSPEDLAAKAEYYLNHPEERRAVALNALRRTFSEHTYSHRIAAMLGIVFG